MEYPLSYLSPYESPLDDITRTDIRILGYIRFELFTQISRRDQAGMELCPPRSHMST